MRNFRISRAIEISGKIARLVWDAICSWVVQSQTVKSFRIVGVAVFNLCRYNKMLKNSVVFALAMAEGGILIQTSTAEENRKASEIHSVVQFDGDIITKVEPEIISRTPGEQATLFERHYHDVEAALSPLQDMQALISISWALGPALAAVYITLVEAPSFLCNVTVFTDLKIFQAPAIPWLRLMIALLSVLFAWTPKILRWLMGKRWEKHLRKFMEDSWRHDKQAKKKREGKNYASI